MSVLKVSRKSVHNLQSYFTKCALVVLSLTSDDWPSDPSNKSRLKCKKGPLSHEKMKCLFLDYVQILMISEAIQAMKVNQPMPPIFSH